MVHCYTFARSHETEAGDSPSRGSPGILCHQDAAIADSMHITIWKQGRVSHACCIMFPLSFDARDILCRFIACLVGVQPDCAALAVQSHGNHNG